MRYRFQQRILYSLKTYLKPINILISFLFKEPVRWQITYLHESKSARTKLGLLARARLTSTQDEVLTEISFPRINTSTLPDHIKYWSCTICSLKRILMWSREWRGFSFHAKVIAARLMMRSSGICNVQSRDASYSMGNSDVNTLTARLQPVFFPVHSRQSTNTWFPFINNTRYARLTISARRRSRSTRG